jgi:transcriptional regulator with XRE-family HTH domain
MSRRFSGATLKRLRTDARMSRSTLGMAIGRSEYSILEWERGLHSPRRSVLPLLASVLRCRVDDLFEDSVRQDEDDGRGEGAPESAPSRSVDPVSS